MMHESLNRVRINSGLDGRTTKIVDTTKVVGVDSRKRDGVPVIEEVT